MNQVLSSKQHCGASLSSLFFVGPVPLAEGQEVTGNHGASPTLGSWAGDRARPGSVLLWNGTLGSLTKWDMFYAFKRFRTGFKFMIQYPLFRKPAV